ncbi:MAG: hypothetical protein AMXMBFR64_35490 [Myxococcales bacterium]
MPRTERKGRSGEEKREQLRKAAYRCLRDFGYNDTTVDGICEAAGSSKGSFYWHYTSKQEVFIDILETWSREVMDQLYEQFQTATGREDVMRVFTEGLSRELHRGRVIVPLWLELTVLARREPEVREALSKFYRRARTAVAEILRPLLEDMVTEDELKGIAGTLFGGYAGLLMQDMSDPDHADAGRVIERFMGVLGRWFRQVRELRQTGDESPELEPLIAALDERARRLFLDVRAVVRQALPDSEERVISGWRVVAYGDGRLVCYLKPRRDGVHLGFYHGAVLPDPDGLLVGTGKRMRHVPISAGEPLRREALVGLLRAAWGAS